VDIFDHVNGGNFCDYMEEVIAQFRRKLKYWDYSSFLYVNLKIDYIRQIRYPSNL
jgi:acyl-CoA thioesterase FadM